MNKTQNFGMSLPDLSNNADINVLNENFNSIDGGLSPFYVATQEDTNIYKITTGLNKNSLNNGYCIRVAIPSDSTNNVSITVDNITCRVMKSNGNYVKNFKANAVYSLTYYNSVFILTSGGGGDDVNFTSNKLLEGYTANDSDGEKVTGTMKNNNQIWSKINAGDSVMIPEGYHNGLGMVTANSLSSQTVGNATSEQILQGYSAWANGQKINGNIVDRGTITTSLNADQVYTIPQGYHSGQGRVVANSLASQTSGNATSSQILSGYNAWVNGQKIWGGINSKGATTYTPSTSSQVINGGQYLSGSQTILGDENLKPENILSGKSIFGVDGSITLESIGNGIKNYMYFINTSGDSEYELPSDPDFIVLVADKNTVYFCDSSASFSLADQTKFYKVNAAASFSITKYDRETHKIKVTRGGVSFICRFHCIWLKKEEE